MHTLRIQRSAAGLVVVDFQERLLPAMVEPERTVQNAARLVQAAGILNVPVFVTEQYPKGLGPTVPELASVLPPGVVAKEKVTFSALGAEGFLPMLRLAGVQDVILCGIETHVCVCQTALDMLAEKFRVFVVADAVSSRTRENSALGLDRMRQAGVVVLSTEMAVFEWLGRAGTDEFKRVMPLVK